MKIRIKGDSLRYRLTKSDVAALANNAHLQEKTNFVKQPLIYELRTTDLEKLSASYINDTITLYIPKIMVAELADTDRVGFEAKDGMLLLLIEKDFTCLDNVEEDQSDNYPNPLAKKLHEHEN